MHSPLSPLSNRSTPSGLVVAGLGFILTRFTVSLAVTDDLMQFVFAGVVPLVLGLGLSATGIALTVGEFDTPFVRTVALWTLIGIGSMFALVGLTLIGGVGTAAFGSGTTQGYLTNFLIGGGVGGALTGAYAGRSNRQQRELEQQAARLDLVNRILRDRVLNALTVIRGRVEVARSLDEPVTADVLSTVDDRSAGVEQVIQNVKHITRGGDAPSLDPVSVAPCVESGVATVRERYPNAAYDLTVDVPADLQVRANAMLEQLVAHLVENAVVYNDSDRPQVDVSVSATDDTVRVSVGDDGPGLPDEQLDLLERGDIGSYEDRSTGFGLDLVRLLVGSYGGRTEASVSDTGTTITLVLPRASTEGDAPLARADSVYGIPPRDVGVAALAAVVAGVVMGVPLQLLGDGVPVVGALYGVANPLIGWITHTFHSIVFGLVFAALVHRVSDRTRYYAIAFAWAAALWLVAAGVVMPLWLSLVGIDAPLPSISPASLAAHLVWGGSLAACYRYGRRWLGAPA